MWVFPVTLEGSSLPFLLAEPGSHEEARTKAEEVATFLGWPVEDFVVVPAGDLGKLAPGGRGIA